MISVRTHEDILNLDEELALFEEDSWDFYDPVINHVQNYEYFNDIRDTEFVKEHRVLKRVALGTALICTYAVGVFVLLLKTGAIGNDLSYESAKKIDSTLVQQNIIYETGVSCNSADIISASQTLASYFKVLRDKTGYIRLNDLCSGTSKFNDTYSNYLNKSQYSFDSFDCYARLLSEFGSFCNISKINKLIERDGNYYCYASISMPSAQDAYEYVYLYQYSFTKHFSADEVNEANVVRYLLDLTNSSAVPCTTSEYCIVMEKKNGVLLIKDDFVITNQCMQSYSTSIGQIISILGGNLTEKMG